MELCLKYLATISATPSNPAYQQTTKDFLTEIFRHKPRLPKPLWMRIQHYKEALDINFPPIALRSLGQSPPWQEFTTNMDLSMSEHNRPTTLPSTFRTLFLAIQEKYNNYDEYYTDGSVTTNHSGFAVVTYTNTVNSSRMHNMCSIWTVIYSDSLSALLAIKNQFNVHPLIQHIHKLLEEIAALDIIISFVWVPAHQGIVGNELADKAAKEAITQEIAPNLITAHLDVKKLIKTKIKSQWNHQ
ncbi:Protein of unknown function [Cotesia congregata]|uniref:RNase H type-1 domain-containing protein n=1 Tax=Cotesia congregata TaxID=51543 RepID=A0A8J2HIZ7_COTCN|nr:Protein of unknown function [Cotesia congregata]